jgi:CelD/BcsL family acetyltransferase involved in cellulose biosynthesis
MANVSLLKKPRFADAETASRRYTVSVDFDLTAISPQWRELESNGGLTPFQTQAWLLPWYQIVAPAHGILPIFVTVRDVISGRPMMLLPLCLRRERGIVTIKFPDCGVSDYNSPLLSPNFQPSANEFEALWNDISRALPRADLISFEKMPEFIGNRLNPMVRLTGSRSMRVRAWGFDLPKSRAEYDKSLKYTVRKRLRRNCRKFELEGPVRFVRAISEVQAREIFKVLRQQRWERCVELGRHDILSEPAFFRFYESVIFDNWTKRFGVLSALIVGEEIAATLFALNHRGRYLILIHCFETGRWDPNSPGIAAINRAITDQIEAGATYFDLTVGNEIYKLQFGVTEHFLYSREQGLSLLGLAYVAMRETRRFVGEQIRKLPKKYWPEHMKG